MVNECKWVIESSRRRKGSSEKFSGYQKHPRLFRGWILRPDWRLAGFWGVQELLTAPRLAWGNMYLYIPGSQTTLVLEGSNPKIEDKQVSRYIWKSPKRFFWGVGIHDDVLLGTERLCFLWNLNFCWVIFGTCRVHSRKFYAVRNGEKDRHFI